MLQQKSTLVNSIEILMPTRETAAAEKYAAIISDITGGVTVAEKSGYWKDDTGLLVKDIHTSFTAFFEDNETQDIAGSLFDVAADIKTEFNQECVSVIWNNKLFFVG